jgi:hypothetical protein
MVQHVEEEAMGFIEPIAIATALPSGVLSFGPSLALWVPLVVSLSVAALGIGLALPRRHRPLQRLTLVHSAAVS